MRRAAFVVFLLLLIILVSVRPVYAQTSSPSPTPTASAFPVTSPTPMPTATPMPTVTPTPTPTASPTITTTQSSNATIPIGLTYDVQTELNLYATAKISISYVYTDNFTGPIGLTTASNATTSVWHMDESPMSMIFYTSDIDTYSFDILLRYTQVVDQTIIITSWSGDLQPNTMRYHIKDSLVYLHFSIAVSTEPTYPSTEAVANESVSLMRGDLEQYYQQLDTLTNELTMNTWEMWAVWAGTIITVIIALIVSLVTLRKLQSW